MSIRQYPRIHTDLVAELPDVTGNGGHRQLSVKELGQGGALLRGDARLGNGRVVVLVVHFPKGKLRLIARVLYEYPAREGFSSGVLFEGIEENPPQLLVDYIDAMLSTAAIWLPREPQ
jgi:hypothetical protein